MSAPITQHSAVAHGTPITISHLTKRFGALTALDDVSLSIDGNEFISIVGRSGCGKSTLLSIIAGLDGATEGQVDVGGEEVYAPGRDRGVVFQNATLLPWMTAQENVEFALKPSGMSRRERADTAREYLALVGLTGFEGHYASQLSGGMQQRVALARSFSYQPRILLLDEPFGALDALTRRTMQRLLTEIWEKHRLTVVLITHDVEEAVYTSDRVVVMSARPGRIRAEVPIELERPRDPHVIDSPEFRDYATEVLDLIHEGTV